jgi:DNA-binding NtrC family response regulator
MERLVTFTDSDTITTNDLPPELLPEPSMLDGGPLSYNEAKKKALDDFNRSIITKSLLKHEGNVTRAAEELKLDRANFQRLMRKYGISSKEFKEQSPDEATKASEKG